MALRGGRPRRSRAGDGSRARGHRARDRAGGRGEPRARLRTRGGRRGRGLSRGGKPGMPRISARPRRLPRPPGRASFIVAADGSIVSVASAGAPGRSGGYPAGLMAGLRRVDGTPSPSERSPAIRGRSASGAPHPTRAADRWPRRAPGREPVRRPGPSGLAGHLAGRPAGHRARRLRGRRPVPGWLAKRVARRRRWRRIGSHGHGRGRWAARRRGGLGVRGRCGDDGQGHRLALGGDGRLRGAAAGPAGRALGDASAGSAVDGSGRHRAAVHRRGQGRPNGSDGAG